MTSIVGSREMFTPRSLYHQLEWPKGINLYIGNAVESLMMYS